MRLTHHGIVMIYPRSDGPVQITAQGFEADGATCREVAIMAVAWAIGELQREMLATIETPGGGRIGVD